MSAAPPDTVPWRPLSIQQNVRYWEWQCSRDPYPFLDVTRKLKRRDDYCGKYHRTQKGAISHCEKLNRAEEQAKK